ncbi:alpha-L-rhamnosidase-related protein [Prolixibacter bellariivorans]|nr:amylo-alpha-1,6-glucosidase [Prolixibacter bellariivorans]
MKKGILLVISMITLAGCHQENRLLYKAENYKVYANRVVQGKYKAKVISPTQMVSDYQSPANDNFPNFIEFKFAVNGKDNELPVGVNHTFLLNPDKNKLISLPTIEFGKKGKDETQSNPTGSLPANTKMEISLDARALMKDFKEKGFHQFSNGSRIYKDDFKGIFIAGNLSPLSWDFDNLATRKQFQLTDPDGDGIYTTTVVLNPYEPGNFTAKKWSLKNDISGYPQLHSDIPLVDAMYNMSLDETVQDIESDGTFRTGESWPGVWTRDVSYSIILAYAYLEPEVAKTSLMRKVKNGRIIQDTGTGGAWPVSSDRSIWATAAWEIYKVTGDQEWLKKIYPIIKNSVDDDIKTLLNNQNHLMMGESSFLDWRKQTYPAWMNGVDISQSRCLGTNAVHFHSLMILSQMAKMMEDTTNRYVQLADSIKADMNSKLWVKEKGYYGQYLYGRNNFSLSTRSEALGEALSVLFGVADTARVRSILEKTPVVDYGIPTIYPQIPEIPPYHNNSIWPFVQAYWNWANARHGNMAGLEQGLAALYRPAALFLTNKENMVAGNGDFRDTQVNSNRQLWSIAGNLAMVYRVFLGMDFHVDGIEFAPVVPKAYRGSFEVTSFHYRKMNFSIKVKGYGDEISHFFIDGKETKDSFLPGNLSGKHKIVIEMNNRVRHRGSINRVANRFSPAAPMQVKLKGDHLTWRPVKGADSYTVYRNGKFFQMVSDTAVRILLTTRLAEYQVETRGKADNSFLSQPVDVISPKRVIEVEAEQVAQKSSLDYHGYSGSGFVELTKNKNRKLVFHFTVNHTGKYTIDFRYSNGSGPDNTDNKCAIRTVNVDNQFAGVAVFAQRGKDEWSNWGWSNPIQVELKAGKNALTLSLEDFNQNMNGDINTAMLDYMRVRPL